MGVSRNPRERVLILQNFQKKNLHKIGNILGHRDAPTPDPPMYYYPFYINYCLISISVEGLKLIEIERCKKDISDIKNQLHESQKRLGDFNRLRWESLPSYF